MAAVGVRWRRSQYEPEFLRSQLPVVERQRRPFGVLLENFAQGLGIGILQLKGEANQLTIAL